MLRFSFPSALVLVVLCNSYPRILCHLIRVSSNIGFSGTPQEINLGNSCFNLAHPINDDISSVDPNGKCIKLYTNERCRGPFIETEEAITDLTSRDINDAISSIKLCHALPMSSRSKFARPREHNKLEDDLQIQPHDTNDKEDILMNMKYEVRNG